MLTFPFLNFVKVEYWENFPGIEDSWTHVVSSSNIAQPIMHDELSVKLGKKQSLNSSLICTVKLRAIDRSIIHF